VSWFSAGARKGPKEKNNSFFQDPPDWVTKKMKKGGGMCLPTIDLQPEGGEDSPKSSWGRKMSWSAGGGGNGREDGARVKKKGGEDQ